MLKKAKLFPEVEERQLSEPTAITLPRKISTFMPASDIGPHFKEMKRNSLINAILGILTFSLGYLENELFFANSFISNVQISFLRTIVMLLCFLQAILVYRFYLSLMSIRIAYAELDPDSKRHLGSIWDVADLRKYCIIELLISMIFTPPGVDMTFNYEQLGHKQTLSLDDMLMFVMVLKSYFVLKLFCILSRHFGMRSRFFW